MKMSMNKFYECIKQKKVNNSHAREVIYNVLLDSKECLSVSEIMRKIQESSSRKVSLNTVYRHLTLFIECGLAVVVQDDFKKSYYILTTTIARVFTLCPKCNDVSVLSEVDHMEAILNHLKSSEFITLHKRCEKCKYR